MSLFGKVPTNVMLNSSLSLEARGLYALLLCLQGKEEYCYPTINWISSKTGYRRSKVFELLNELSIVGLIARAKDPLLKKTVTYIYTGYEQRNEDQTEKDY